MLLPLTRQLYNLQFIFCTDYLNALIQSHLQICSNAEATPAFPLANTVKHISQSYKSQIADSMQALYTFIPRNFSPNFRNPCWYDSLQVPQTLYRRLTHYAGPLPHTELQYSDKQAAEIMETVLSIRANRTSIFSYLGTKSSVLPNVPASSKLYCLPPILLAGFPKCATSTLHNMLLRVGDHYSLEYWAASRDQVSSMNKYLFSL